MFSNQKYNNLFYIICYTNIFFVVGDSTLTGHLLPLGHQTKPTVKIDEFTLENAPTPERFYNDYIKSSKAAIFRNVVSDTNAFKLWNDEYLKEHYGNLEVRIEGKREKKDSYPIGEKYMGRDTISHFIENYHSPDSVTYIVSELPKQMYNEVGVVPSLGACGDMVNSFVEIDLWWSGGNSKSVIHKDAFNQMNCLYHGTKHWKLFEYKYEKWIYKHDEGANQLGGFSDVNIRSVNLKKHPNFAKIPWSNVTINAGDCLYLPKSCYHQVDSDGPFNLAVSVLFSRFDEKFPKNFSDCTSNTDYKNVRPLSDFDVMWQWKGTGIMSMGYGDLEENYRLLHSSYQMQAEMVLSQHRVSSSSSSIAFIDRLPLLEEAKQAKRQGSTLNFESILQMFEDETLDPATRKRKLQNAFDFIDANKDGKVTVKEIKSANFEELRGFGEMVEPYEPSNSYTFEYSYLSYWEVMRFLKRMLKSNEKLMRSDWTEKYIKRFLGSKSCADEIFNAIAQSNVTDVVESKNVKKEDIERALINWKRYYSPIYFNDPNPNKPDQRSNSKSRKDEKSKDNKSKDKKSKDKKSKDKKSKDDLYPGYEADDDDSPIEFDEEFAYGKTEL